jgi:hypothetical protein
MTMILAHRAFRLNTELLLIHCYSLF